MLPVTRIRSYYFEFDETGVKEIDDLLVAVADAGGRCHHTVNWTETSEYVDESCVAMIQRIANEGAETLKAALTTPNP